jgi:DMSO/TMAO reductase YedYZ molybdopterin-dependent catalytic subunit
MTPDASEVPGGRTVRRGLFGAAIGFAWVAGLFVAGPLVGGFGVAAIAEGIIVRSPGWLSTLAVRLLGFAAIPTLVAGVVVAVVGATALVAIVWPSGSDGVAAVAVGSLVATGTLFFAGGVEIAVGTFVALVVAVVSPTAAARWLPAAVATDDSTGSDRRQFLSRLGTVSVLGLVSLGALRILFERLVEDRSDVRVGEPLESSVSPPGGDPAFDFEGMPAAITSPDAHYTVDIDVRPPPIDSETWTLDIEGAVGEPYSLSYDELLEHGESVEQPTTMVCISNQVGGDLIGTGHWSGVPLSALVGAAEPAETAVDVVTHAEDGYSEAIPIGLIEREDILIAYGLGERTLPAEHGFPARLLVPGRYGMKMTKWIDRIEVRTKDHEAYWEARGWDEEAVVNTLAYVRGAERDGDRVRVGGVAFGGLETGAEEIAAVEVSVDGGETWQEAELERQVAPHAWRRWRYGFDAPDRSEFEVLARAIERDGTVQTEERTDPRPGGSTGWHRTTVRPG